MIGIDIVSIKRIENLIKNYPQKALRRFLNDEEIALAQSVETIAGFYAAKEAISKALGTGIGKECGFLDIRLHKTSQGAPYFTLPKRVIDKFFILETDLSITHDGGFAIAVAVIRQKIPPRRAICH